MCAICPRDGPDTRGWLTPRIYGAPQFEKPIFYYWLVAASFKALGETEFSGRLPTALSATILVLLTWLWGRRTFNPRAGFLAALILATGLEFSVMSRLMLTDVPLAVFLAASLFSYWQAITGTARRQAWLFAHYVFTALAVLTKGPIGSLVPLLAILTFSAITRTPLLLRGKGFLAGLAAYALLVVPWYALMFVPLFGRQFWEEFFVRDNWLPAHLRAGHPANNAIGKILRLRYPLLRRPLADRRVRSPGFPRSLLTLRRLWGDARQDRRLMFLCSWLLSSLVFLTIAQSKLPSYCFFLFVPLGLLVGVTLESICRVGFRTRGECRLVVGAAVFQCVAALAAPLVKVAQPLKGFGAAHRGLSRGGRFLSLASEMAILGARQCALLPGVDLLGADFFPGACRGG